MNWLSCACDHYRKCDIFGNSGIVINSSTIRIEWKLVIIKTTDRIAHIIHQKLNLFNLSKIVNKKELINLLDLEVQALIYFQICKNIELNKCELSQIRLSKWLIEQQHEELEQYFMNAYPEI